MELKSHLSSLHAWAKEWKLDPFNIMTPLSLFLQFYFVSLSLHSLFAVAPFFFLITYFPSFIAFIFFQPCTINHDNHKGIKWLTLTFASSFSRISLSYFLVEQLDCDTFFCLPRVSNSDHESEIQKTRHTFLCWHVSFLLSSCSI